MSLEGFSSTLKISDLNDFISPSQECVKPVLVEKTAKRRGIIQVDEGGGYREVDKLSIQGITHKLERAQITLSDCLACSGCVTSAETVLIQQQGYLELVKVLDGNRAARVNNTKAKYVVVSVSPQSRASLASKYKRSLLEANRWIRSFLRQIGVDLVLDTSVSRHLSLLAICEEFCERFAKCGEGSETNGLPLIASACPGWVCYAEKSLGAWILNHMSKSRSPQAIMGAVVKDFLAGKLGLQAEDIYHLCVMPCFDKKLEASRSELVVPGTNVREVDCVISTEFLQMMDHFDCSCTPNVTGTDERCQRNLLEVDDVFVHAGGGSGGYAEQVFRYASAKLFDQQMLSVTFSPTRNKDLQEAKLELDSKVVLNVALAYGFRNIQSLVQKIKKGNCPYHFVEIMACPSGCLNGGGQIRSEVKAEEVFVLKHVQDLYCSAKTVLLDDYSLIEPLLSEWLKGSLSSQKAKQFLYTSYNVVPPMTNSLAIKW